MDIYLSNIATSSGLPMLNSNYSFIFAANQTTKSGITFIVDNPNNSSVYLYISTAPQYLNVYGTITLNSISIIPNYVANYTIL